jgi:hypothetical protein
VRRVVCRKYLDRSTRGRAHDDLAAPRDHGLPGMRVVAVEADKHHLALAAYIGDDL